jgi:hypothetical protein
MRLFFFEHPLRDDLRYLVYVGPGFAHWYLVTHVNGEAVEWQLI